MHLIIDFPSNLKVKLISYRASFESRLCFTSETASVIKLIETLSVIFMMKCFVHLISLHLTSMSSLNIDHLTVTYTLI